MPTIHLETTIAAPIETCFDLARDIDEHQASTAPTHERAVGGVTRGLIGLGESVTWEAVHFGLPQRLTVRITAFERPVLFVDEQTSGPFQSLRHVHCFQPVGEGTLMVDDFTFASPLGPLGWLVDRLVLGPYLRALLTRRNAYLAWLAEHTRPIAGQRIPDIASR